jgi:hypothetical protein
VPGLSSGQVTGALSALNSLPTLAAGSSVPGGSLAPLAAILSQITTLLSGSGSLVPATRGGGGTGGSGGGTGG